MLKLVRTPPEIVELSDVFKSLRLVIVDTPYDLWDQRIPTDLFMKIVGLKLKGYRKEYPYGVMPVDTTDFIAAHQMVCVELEGTLTPIMAYKTVTYSRCKTFNLPFPALAVARAAKLTEHEQVVQSILDRCDREGKEVCYDSSWTIDPMVRQSKDLTAHLRELMTAMYVRFHQYYDIPELVGCGAIRFKTEKYFQYWGYHPLSKDGIQLPNFHQLSLMGEEAMMLHLDKFSPEAKAIADKHQQVWEERIVFAADSAGQRQKKKAA